jgi:hypothetical protein
MEGVGIFYGNLVHCTVFCYILLTFGMVRCNLVYIAIINPPPNLETIVSPACMHPGQLNLHFFIQFFFNKCQILQIYERQNF